MPKPDDAEFLEMDGHTVRISSPSKPYFSQAVQLSKLDIVRYFLSVAPAALRGITDRPIVLKRFVNGANLATGQPEPFYQKRAPTDLPAWMRTVTLSFPSGRTADEVVVDNTAGLAWIANLGCIELHPHPVRSADLDHPDELRIDLDPQPGIPWADVRAVALEVKALLDELGLAAWPKTSGSRGIHINVRIHPRWTFTEVRRAALALARAVERRCPLATSKWWKEERHGVFLDYNQNAKDRTTAAAYSVRPLPDARVSTPLHWHEVLTCDPADFTVLTVPARFAALGDPHADMDQQAASLDALLDLAARDEAEGLGDAPWPPHFAKQEGEAKRVQPSKAKPAKPFADQLNEGFGAHRFRKQAKKTAASRSSSGRQPAEPAADSRTSSGRQAAEAGTRSSSGLQPAETPAAREGASATGTDAADHAAESASSRSSSGLQAAEPGTGTSSGLQPAAPAPDSRSSSGLQAAETPAAREGASAPGTDAADHTAESASSRSSSGLQPAESAPDSRSSSGLQAAETATPTEGASAPARKGRIPKMPLLTIAQSPDRAAAEAGLERWKAAHPEAAALLAPDDILTDRMRGASTIWYRIRINLRHVPETQRPTQQTPDPDDDPTREWRERGNPT